MEITVRHSGIIRLKSVETPGAGAVLVAEAAREIPFSIKRVYFIKGMGPASVRGNHAHKRLTQAMFVLQGSCTLSLDDGIAKQDIRMDDPATGALLGPHLWVTMKDFSPDCVIAVFADDYYDASEYIQDYQEFLNEK